MRFYQHLFICSLVDESQTPASISVRSACVQSDPAPKRYNSDYADRQPKQGSFLSLN